MNRLLLWSQVLFASVWGNSIALMGMDMLEACSTSEDGSSMGHNKWEGESIEFLYFYLYLTSNHFLKVSSLPRETSEE